MGVDFIIKIKHYNEDSEYTRNTVTELSIGSGTVIDVVNRLGLDFYELSGQDVLYVGNELINFLHKNREQLIENYTILFVLKILETIYKDYTQQDDENVPNDTVKFSVNW